MATEAHLLTKSVLEHRKSIASKTKSWPSVSGHDFERRKTFVVEAGALCAAALHPKVISEWCARQDLNLHACAMEPKGDVTLVKDFYDLI